MITFLLARVGYGGNYPSFGPSTDEAWLGYLTLGGWCIIIPAIILGIILGHPMHWTMVRTNLDNIFKIVRPYFQDTLFSVVGSFLYIASGSSAINSSQSINRDSSMVLGSFCIVTGSL